MFETENPAFGLSSSYIEGTQTERAASTRVRRTSSRATNGSQSLWLVEEWKIFCPSNPETGLWDYGKLYAKNASSFPQSHNHYYCFNQRNERKENTKLALSSLTFT